MTKSITLNEQDVARFWSKVCVRVLMMVGVAHLDPDNPYTETNKENRILQNVTREAPIRLEFFKVAFQGGGCVWVCVCVCVGVVSAAQRVRRRLGVSA